jgi:hypothetical protein
VQLSIDKKEEVDAETEEGDDKEDNSGIEEESPWEAGVEAVRRRAKKGGREHMLSEEWKKDMIKESCFQAATRRRMRM